MNIFVNPPRGEWAGLCRRAEQDNSLIEERVQAIVDRVAREGDAALKAGHVRSQLQTLPEAGLSLSQTVRNQDSKPFQRVLGSWGGVWLWGPWETLAPAQS